VLIVKSRDLRQRHRNAVARSDESGACAPRFAPDTRRLLKLLCDKLDHKPHRLDVAPSLALKPAGSTETD
jgi:hypothetical protein